MTKSDNKNSGFYEDTPEDFYSDEEFYSDEDYYDDVSFYEDGFEDSYTEDYLPAESEYEEFPEADVPGDSAPEESPEDDLLGDFVPEESPEDEPKEKKPLSRKKKKRIRNTVLPFFAAMGILSVISWYTPLRPSFSDLEKRELSHFPEFSFSALFSGDWFDGISLWFSDTFPGRESWVRAQSGFERSYGDRSITYSGSLVTLDVPVTPAPEPVVTVQPAPEAEIAEEPVSTPEPIPTPNPEEGVNFEAAQARRIGATVYFGDSAYELYGGNALASQTYSKTLSKCADKYEGRYRFFTMICPNSGGIVLSYDVYDQLYPVRQGDAVNTFYENRSENLIPVLIYDTLRAHNTEYLYFRTDHHWTALGAYYAYTEFCKAAGFEPVPLSHYTAVEMDPFLGSFYQHNPNKDMENNPDTVIAYIPPGNIRCTAISPYLQRSEIETVMDQKGRGSEKQYLCFLGGDHYLTEIINDDIEDDSAILVVKDSYGNPFSIYLSQHYHTVLSMDWHYSLNIREQLAKYNVKDILVLSELVLAQGTEMLNNLYGDFLVHG